MQMLLLLAFTLTTAQAQPAPQDAVDERTEMVQAIESIERSQKELKGLKVVGPDKCWQCAFKQKPHCDFNDVCRDLKTQRNGDKLYSKSDGTYVPNSFRTMALANFRECTAKAREQLQAMPDPKEGEEYQRKNLALLKMVEETDSTKAYVAISRQMAEKPPEFGSSFDKQIRAAEKASGQTLPAKVREAWAGVYQMKPIQAVRLESISSDPMMDPESLAQARAMGGFAGPGAPRAGNPALARLTQRESVANSTFEDMRGRMIALLESKRTPTNTAQIDSLITRVRTVKMQMQMDPNACAFGNGEYRGDDHKVLVCPQLTVYPGPALEQLLAHEIAHAIDPCLSGDTLYDLGNGLYTTVDGRGGKAAAAAMTTAAYPFNSVVECLQGDSSVAAEAGARIPNDLKRLKKKLTALEESGGADSKDAAHLRAEIARFEPAENRAQIARCSQAESQLQEATADWLSWELMAQKIPDDPQAARQYIFEASTWHADLGCHSVFDVPDDFWGGFKSCLGMTSPKQAVTVNESMLDFKAHPPSASRVNRLWMAHPKVREATECPKTSVVYCE